MPVGLFIPCYIDQFYPRVGLATLEILEHFGVQPIVPDTPTCCGQPMANTGVVTAAEPLAAQYLESYGGCESVVCPSGSCTAMIREHYAEFSHSPFAQGSDRFNQLRSHTFELCEYLWDVLGVRQLEGSFPAQVGLHSSCHGLRELRLGSGSERNVAPFSKVQQLLATLEGITFSELTRVDECCGFGGTFAVSEESISCIMGQDRLADHRQAGTQVLTAVDMSCLMHLDGLSRREDRNTATGASTAPPPLEVLHVAELIHRAMFPERTLAPA